MSKDKDSGGFIEKAAESVPALYYDLVARILPGSAFCFAASWSPASESSARFDLSDLALLIGAGYLVGILLTGVSTLLLDWSWACVVKLPLVKKFADGADVTGGPARLALQIDSVLVRNADAGHTLFKMFGEAVACENMLSGLLVLLAFPLIGLDSVVYQLGVAGAIVLAIVMFWTFMVRAVTVSVRCAHLKKEIERLPVAVSAH